MESSRPSHSNVKYIAHNIVTNNTVTIAAKYSQTHSDVYLIYVTGPPEAPSNLGVTDIRSRTALLQFVPNLSNEPVTKWIVEAQEFGSDLTEYTEIYQISAHTAASILVQNLRPFTWYKLRLIAENRFGRSPPSFPTRPFMTNPGSPDVPSNFAVEAVNSTALLLTWSPLSDRDWNAPDGRGFVVRLKREYDSSYYTYVIPPDNDSNRDNIVLARLASGAEYEVEMRAKNNYGSSDWTPVVRARTTVW